MDRGLPAGPEGRLSLAWPTHRIGPAGPAPGARLLQAEWQDAASALTPIRPLGHYTLTLTQAGHGAELALASQSGPLLLQGTGTLDSRTGLRFQGTAQADPAESAGVHAALQDVLNALGPRRNNVTQLDYR